MGTNFALMLKRVAPLDISCSSPFFSRYRVWEIIGMAWREQRRAFLFQNKCPSSSAKAVTHRTMHTWSGCVFESTLSLSNSSVFEIRINSSICRIFPTSVLHSSIICGEKTPSNVSLSERSLTHAAFVLSDTYDSLSLWRSISRKSLRAMADVKFPEERRSNYVDL